jgi:hypothetical protein
VSTHRGLQGVWDYATITPLERPASAQGLVMTEAEARALEKGAADRVYSRPWTGDVPFRATREPIYEYACHEANYALENILRGERARDRQRP